MMRTIPVRWRVADPNNRAEMVRREKLLSKIDRWWDQFMLDRQKIEDAFARKTNFDLSKWMNRNLESIDKHLMWEYGRAVRSEGHRLVITPESSRYLCPLVDAILKRAPQFEKWEFYPSRLPEHITMANLTTKARTGGTLDGAVFSVAIGDHHQIDLCYSSPRVSSSDDEQAFSEALVATEALLGEEWLYKWVGAIEVDVLSEVRARAQELVSPEQLRHVVERLVQNIKNKLPAMPHHQWAEEAEWTLYELHPEQERDYPSQQDLFVGKSANPDMWTTAQSTNTFYSERFSGCGETFCYVKLDGSEGLDEEKFADKSEIEDAIDAVLKPDRIGCHIGGGTGLRYSYIDLAVMDVPKAIDRVRERLKQGNVPKRSWILFFDADLASEWVGVYSDSPLPPLPRFE